jgi:gamma-glutamylcyclotransferase (GGCT)/AIG2-like uncharacterized protein YtfP
MEDAGGVFVSEGVTLPEYTMFAAGVPYVARGGTTAIKGEVYEVPEAGVLGPLDRLEGHPRHYVRTPIALADGREVEIYLMPEELAARATREGMPTIPSGDWLNLEERRAAAGW